MDALEDTTGSVDSGKPDGQSALRRILSWAWVFLPPVLTVPWVLLLSPLKLVEDVFSIPSALAASALLTLVLAAVKRRRVPKKWIILPLLCWLYECLPITLPGPLDNLLTVGGSGMVTFWAWAKKSHLPWQ